MRIVSLITACIIFSGCVSATIQVDSTCHSNKLPLQGFPLVSGLVGERTVEIPATIDLSKVLLKVGDVSQPNIDSASFNLDSRSLNLGFIHHVKLLLRSSNGELVVADSDIKNPGYSVTIPLSIDGGKLLSFLKLGPNELVLYLTGSMPEVNSVYDTSFCVAASSEVKKSLSDIAK